MPLGRTGGNPPPTKRTQKRVTEHDVLYVQSHPEMTAEEIGAWLGRTARSVEHIRSRFGRHTPRRGICWACDSRPVWEDSPDALKMGLCKGCYLDEMERREAEEPRDNAFRQRKFKRNRRERARRG